MLMTDRNKGSLSQVGMACLIHVIQFAGADNNYGNESDEKHQRSQYAEEVHRLDAEGGKEPKGN